MKISIQPGSAQISPEVRAFVTEAFSLCVDGPLPAGVRKRYPCCDIPLAPKGTLLTPWSARDAALWMLDWPPRDGELYSPLDVWDEEIAASWLERHRPIEELDAPELIAFRKRRSAYTATEVLADLDDDSLLVLTDAVLCERIRREVMPPLLAARAAEIRTVAQRVGTGSMTMTAARKSSRQHDENRDAMLRDAFADNDDWIGEWIVDLSQGLIDLYVWPRGFSARDLLNV